MDKHYHSEHLPRNPTVKRLPAHHWSQENSVMVTKITRTGPGTGGSLNLMTSRFSYRPETGDDAAAHETTSLRVHNYDAQADHSTEGLDPLPSCSSRKSWAIFVGFIEGTGCHGKLVLIYRCWGQHCSLWVCTSLLCWASV